MTDSEIKDHNSFAGRVKRYTAVSTAVGGAAAKLASNRFFGITLDRAEHAAGLRQALGGLKGPLMKVAQIISTMPDALPNEYVAELAQLQSNAPSMGWLFVKRRMASELGPDWQSKFASFSHEALAAASLGQVHEAHLFDGRKLACKLQYPDMSSAVEADLSQLNMIFGLYQKYDKAMNLNNIYEEVSARLREELDYTREAQNMNLYRKMLADVPKVKVPEVIPELSTQRLISMTWLEGEKILNFKEAPIEERNRIAHVMFHTWYVPFFRYGVIHGDPHLGNYSVREDGGINLLDFGCVRIFPPEFIKGVIDLYRSVRDQNRGLSRQALENWGFGALSEDMVDTLLMWAGFLFEAWIDDRIRPMKPPGAPDGPYGAEVAAKVHKRLREQGGVTPPKEFVMMDRAALGLGSVFLHLKAELNWHNLINQLMDDFDLETVKARQAEALKSVGLT